MAVREYIGARYVPVFDGQWDNTKAYEPLTVVQHEGNTYTSRQFVPIGASIANENYWAETGNFNAQVEAYRQEVLAFDGRITANAYDIVNLTNDLSDFKARFTFDTVQDMIENASLLSVGDICFTKGFSVINEYGHCTYRITDTATANEKDVITCGEKFAVLMPGTWVTPEMFGAIGDGVTNDNDACNFAVDNYQNVYFPNNYLVDEIRVNSTSINIIGSGKITTRSANKSCFFIYKSKNFSISGFELTANWFAITFEGCHNFKVSNLIASPPEGANNTDALHFNGGNSNFVVENISGTSYDDFVALNAYEGSETDKTIENGTFININQDKASRNGLRIYGRDNSQTIRNIKFINCRFCSTGHSIVRFTNAENGNYDVDANNLNCEYISFENCEFYAAPNNGNAIVYFGRATAKKLKFSNCKLVGNLATTAFVILSNSDLDINIENINALMNCTNAIYAKTCKVDIECSNFKATEISTQLLNFVDITSNKIIARNCEANQIMQISINDNVCYALIENCKTSNTSVVVTGGAIRAITFVNCTRAVGSLLYTNTNSTDKMEITVVGEKNLADSSPNVNLGAIAQKGTAIRFISGVTSNAIPTLAYNGDVHFRSPNMYVYENSWKTVQLT